MTVQKKKKRFKINILLITQLFPPQRGGLENAAYYTAKYLAKLGHNVIVLTSKLDEDKRKFFRMDDFLVYRVKSYYPTKFKSFLILLNLGNMPMALIKLAKIIKKHNIQLIHAEGTVFPLSFLSAFLNEIIFKRTMILSAQGRVKIGNSDFIEFLFDKTITKHLSKSLKKIICSSKSLEKHFLRLKIKKEKLILIPNGVDVNIFTRNEKSKFLDHYIKKKENYKKILFIGRLDKQKGVEYLIRAIPNVIEKFKEVHFFILGTGKHNILAKFLKNLVKELDIQSKVTFINEMSLESEANSQVCFDFNHHSRKIAELYSSADIFCLPSIHEGFPLCIAEALSTGLIVVASKTEGIPDAIKENVNGFLAEPQNVPQLTQKLLKALRLNKEEIVKIRNNNITLARKKYSWDVLIKQIEDVYIKSIERI